MTGYDWREDALCAQSDPEAWFPHDGGESRAAKRICAMCPVREACLADCLSMPFIAAGVWGGTTERQRYGMKTTKTHRVKTHRVKGSHIATTVRREKAQRLAHDNVAVEEIADLLDVTVRSVHRYIKRAAA